MIGGQASATGAWRRGDTKAAGTCDKILLSGIQTSCPPEGCGYYCQCGTGEATKTVIESSATGTFTATTLTQYTGLRKSITTTTTATKGDPAVETEVALVVAAGGVAWWLFGEDSRFFYVLENNSNNLNSSIRCCGCYSRTTTRTS